MLTALIVALALHADPKEKPADPNAPKADTMKALLKDAAKNDGPDVSNMPFTPDSIKQIVATYQPKIQGCYEDHIANKKKAPEGKLKTIFTITQDGLVKNAKVDKKGSTLKDPGLHDCVVAVLSTMVFPKPSDGREHPIEFPFNLKAVN
ncbi:MAG: AgmX/PglI C-terminal domain-containing protein [Myxococcaceae bacterium]